MSDSAEKLHRIDVVVDAQGRVAIPEYLRRDAGIEIGSATVMYAEDGRVVMEPCDRLAARLRREVAEKWCGDGGSVADELVADRRAEAARDEPS